MAEHSLAVKCANRLKCIHTAGRRGYVSRLETPDPSHYLAHLKLSCTNPRGPTARVEPDPPPRFLVSHPGTAARRRKRRRGRRRRRRRRRERASQRRSKSTVGTSVTIASCRLAVKPRSRTEAEFSARPRRDPLADVRPFCWLISEGRGGPGGFSTEMGNKSHFGCELSPRLRLMSQHG